MIGYDAPRLLARLLSCYVGCCESLVSLPVAFFFIIVFKVFDNFSIRHGYTAVQPLKSRKIPSNSKCDKRARTEGLMQCSHDGLGR